MVHTAIVPFVTKVLPQMIPWYVVYILVDHVQSDSVSVAVSFDSPALFVSVVAVGYPVRGDAHRHGSAGLLLGYHHTGHNLAQRVRQDHLHVHSHHALSDKSSQISSRQLGS